MQKTYDIRVAKFDPLISPAQLKEELPLTEASYGTVVEGRRAIADILEGKDPRMLVVTGPCSIHDEAAAMDYARRLRELRAQVAETMLLVMRVYFEKPRTNVGWKGLINDPRLDGSYDIHAGLKRARRLLLDITDMGLPTATETPVHCRSGLLGGHWRAYHRIPNPPGDGQRPFHARGLQELYRRRSVHGRQCHDCCRISPAFSGH